MYNVERPLIKNLNIPQERSLMVINDHQIRMDLFSPTAALFKKIKKLAVFQKDFINVDRFLFENWYKLTFREEIRDIHFIEQRQKALLELQIHLLFIAENSKFSLQTAYLLLKEEELQFQRGDEDWKFIIAKLREHRLEYAKSQLNEKMKQHQNSKADCFASFFDTQSVEEKNGLVRSSRECPDLSRLNRKNRALYYYCKEISPDGLEKILNEKTQGQILFKELFKIMMEVGDWHLVAKLWLAASEIYRSKILKKMPSHLFNFLDQMISEFRSKSGVSREDEFSNAELNLKSIYHGLARTFHPDMQSEGCSYEDLTLAERMLKEAQEAYCAKDLEKLKRLEMIALIHHGDLRSFTLEEIYQSSIVLAQELEKLKFSIKLIQRHPAWKFSSRRNYTALIAKIRADFCKKKMPLLAELQDLEFWFSKVGLQVNEMVTPPRLERGSIV